MTGISSAMDLNKFFNFCFLFFQTYFIPISHLYEGFEKRCPNMKHKMWQKIGLAITAQKIREHLSFEVRGGPEFFPPTPVPKQTCTKIGAESDCKLVS